MKSFPRCDLKGHLTNITLEPLVSRVVSIYVMLSSVLMNLLYPLCKHTPLTTTCKELNMKSMIWGLNCTQTLGSETMLAVRTSQKSCWFEPAQSSLNCS